MATNQSEDNLLTIPEVAKELRVSVETARTLTTTGKLPYVNVGSGAVHMLRRVRRGDLDAFKRASRREKADEQFAAARAIVKASTAKGAFY